MVTTPGGATLDGLQTFPASWDRAGSPGQVRPGNFLSPVEVTSARRDAHYRGALA